MISATWVDKMGKKRKMLTGEEKEKGNLKYNWKESGKYRLLLKHPNEGKICVKTVRGKRP